MARASVVIGPQRLAHRRQLPAAARHRRHSSLKPVARALARPQASAASAQYGFRHGTTVGRALYTWTALLALFGWAQVWLAAPRRWVQWGREAVFPCYILHQTLLILLLYGLRPLQLGPWLEPTLVLCGTVLGCVLLYEGLIRRVRWLRPLFGLRYLHRRSLPTSSWRS